MPRWPESVDGPVLRADGALERSQLGSGVESDGPERGPRPLQGAERLGLAPVPIEGESQEAPAPLAQRLVDHHRLELGDDLVMAAGGQLGLAAVFLDASAKLGQGARSSFALCPMLQLRQRIASPQVERSSEGCDRRPDVPGAQELVPGSGVVFEVAGVSDHAFARQPVAARPGLDQSRAQAAPELEHEVLHDLR